MSVVTMRAKLTETDLRMLVKGQSDDDRAYAAHKICRVVDYADLEEDERRHAEEILRLIAMDAAEMVRRSLAVALKNSTKLPPDVARRLAQDVDSIALPILEHSPVLSDADLVEVLRGSATSKQMAVASREQLSPIVCEAIVQVGAPAVVERALANDNAEFAEPTLNRVVEKFGDRQTITGAMARRRTLPVGVVEKLISRVSGEIFDHLVNHHQLPPQMAIDLASGARERATIDLVEQAGLQGDLARFAQQLNLSGRLTPSFLMRALCVGHMSFVEHALAELAGLNHHRAWLMIHDTGPLGLKTLFERAGMPPRLYQPFRAAVEVYHQLERDGLSHDRTLMRQRMIERVLTLFQSIPREDLDYLLEKLDAASEAPGRAVTA